MTEPETARNVSDIDGLLALTELKAVTFNEVSARRADTEDEPNQFRMEVSSLVGDGDSITVRCRAVVDGAGGAYVAEADGLFSLAERVQIDESVLLEFVERVGVMTVYPYLRTAISDLSARIGHKTPVLRLLRPGDVNLQRT